MAQGSRAIYLLVTRANPARADHDQTLLHVPCGVWWSLRRESVVSQTSSQCMGEVSAQPMSLLAASEKRPLRQLAFSALQKVLKSGVKGDYQALFWKPAPVFGSRQRTCASSLVKLACCTSSEFTAHSWMKHEGPINGSGRAAQHHQSQRNSIS